MTSWQRWRLGQSRATLHALGVLWGKSDADGTPNLLIQHLLDTFAVAELLWDRFMAPALCQELDESTGGHGRMFFSWLCGLHDLGKATPAFQSQVRELAVQVRAAGLALDGLGPRPNRRWRHERASACILLEATATAGWCHSTRAWVWPLLAGHHGAFPDKGAVKPPKRALHGRGPEWAGVQEALVALVTAVSGYESLAAVEPSGTPARAFQLALSGLVIMADWIASDDQHFRGIDNLEAVSIEGARERAERAWAVLGLRRGWGRLASIPDDPVSARFGLEARPVQRAVVEAAASLPVSGIIVVEAPTGEGKTEAALAAAEVLASRFGADGVYVGMPTQATSDPMLHRVGAWANEVSPGIQIALLHGKRRFNPEWRALLKRRDARLQAPAVEFSTDEHDLRDDYGVRPAGIDEGASDPDAVAAVEEWLLGPKRGLLSPVAVGTVDQLLFAATRTKHVALRFAGLAGKVVILDEVHAADIYMEQFLHEALWWMGECGVPVVLLSATLAPQQRARLIREYLRGAFGLPGLDVSDLSCPEGYPAVTSAWPEGHGAAHVVRSVEQRKPSRTFRVEVLEEDADPEVGVTRYLREATREGGCVLVLRNTVARAQAAYAALRASIDGEVVLVHGRLTAADRAQRTERLLAQLGPPLGSGAPRPRRLVVVATQVAEQSFDVDVDLLVTDLAPIDLLLQRAGRLHRHDRPMEGRPGELAVPRIVVTGMRCRPERPPEIDQATLAVYGEANRAPSGRGSPDTRTPYRAAAPLLRTAALVEEALRSGGWQLPGDVPGLVARAYGPDLVMPEAWSAIEGREVDAFHGLQERRANVARSFRLAREGSRSGATLAGIHGQASQPGADEELMVAFVRDGPRAVEVLLVERAGERFRTLDGHDLGVHGEGIHDERVRDGVIGASVRLPPWPSLTEEAARLGPQLPELSQHPWTRRANVLVLDRGEAELAGHQIRYDRELGLCVERTPAEAGTT